MPCGEFMIRQPNPDLHFEIPFWQAGMTLIAGLDEAGRGAWAGPVSAGAVILPTNPGFYYRPTTAAELVDFIVARILDQLDIPHALLPRWGEPPEPS